MAPPRPDLRPEEDVYFAAPVTTAGIHVICREPLASANPADHPVSPSWDEMDSIVVFDGVFIPWERGFYLRRSPAIDLAFEARLFQGAVGLGPGSVPLRFAVEAEVLLGVFVAIGDPLVAGGRGARGRPEVLGRLAGVARVVAGPRTGRGADGGPVAAALGAGQPPAGARAATRRDAALPVRVAAHPGSVRAGDPERS